MEERRSSSNFADSSKSRMDPPRKLGARRSRGGDGAASFDGSLINAMFRRQSTAGRGRAQTGGGAGAGLGAAEILSARGPFRKHVRQRLESVPEMVVELKKALASDDPGIINSKVLQVRYKLVEGESEPFELQPERSQSWYGGGPGTRAGGGGGSGSAGNGHHHGHQHGDDEYDDGHQKSGYRQLRRLDREAFVALGGPDLLLQALRTPDGPADARLIPESIVARDSSMWSSILVVLRELCFTDQDLSERLGSSELILYLLTMLSHPVVFDHAVGLVEEILAVKSSTYFLGEVPNLHSLVENMTSQQLAHFSRVLALLVFEPEYRQLMESSHGFRSMELLQLRRDRVARSDSVIDRNQALILSARNLLPRFMELLRVMNFNPPLAAYDDRSAEMEAQMAHVRISLSGQGRAAQQRHVVEDWDHLAHLRADAQTATEHLPPSQAPLSPMGSAGFGPMPPEEEAPRGGRERSRIGDFFRNLFGRPSMRVELSVGGHSADVDEPIEDEAPPRTAEEALQNLREAAAALAADLEEERSRNGGVLPPRRNPGSSEGLGPNGMGTMSFTDFMNLIHPAVLGLVPPENLPPPEQMPSLPFIPPMSGPMANSTGPRAPDPPFANRARDELLLNGIVLAPHQVEVLFVLCTLLGARRKGEAHETLANLGLIDVLDTMFERLSWGVPPRQEGPHGAQCDCNPESALRVQYLRLVHNFLDRDSNNNPLKRLLLSPHEIRLFATGRFLPNPNGSGNVVFVENDAPESEAQPPFAWRGRKSPGDGASAQEAAEWVDTRGLLSKIADVFMQEPMDSLYRFWLASCVEAFLRGGSTQEQLFIAGGGLLPHLVKEITTDGIWCAGSLQTAFDLLGELCKGNREVLEMLEANMTQRQLRRFLEVMVDNLVDSNVFMRSLVLSVEHSAFRRKLGDDMAAGGATGASNDPEYAGASEMKQDAARDQGEEGKASVGDDQGGDLSDSGDSNSDGPEAYDMEPPCYLGHNWCDVHPDRMQAYDLEAKDTDSSKKAEIDGATQKRLKEILGSEYGCLEQSDGGSERDEEDLLMGEEAEEEFRMAEAPVSFTVQEPQSYTRLQCFLKQNTPLLVRDLMAVVNLETINHENICCLNTAVLILIFADRRGQLAELLDEVRKLPAGRGGDGRSGTLAGPGVDLDGLFSDGGEPEAAKTTDASTLGRARGCVRGRSSGGNSSGSSASRGDGNGDGGERGSASSLPDGATVLVGFRRLLWFWSEYYLRGGRDRLSLEFSTHVKFWAWKRVIRLLCADDGSPTALVSEPLKLPRSPYDSGPSTLRE